MPSADPHLKQAFAEACYLIHPSDHAAGSHRAVSLSLSDLRATGWIDTRLGRASPELAAVLRQQGVTHAQLLTPCNPRGRRIADKDNDQALLTMRQMLAQNAQPWLAALSMDGAGGWREPGFLLLGASLERGRQWAQQFDQAAWVEYDAQGQARLRWTATAMERGRTGVSTES